MYLFSVCVFLTVALALFGRVEASFTKGALAYELLVHLAVASTELCASDLYSEGLPQASLRNTASTVYPGFLRLGGQRCDGVEFIVNDENNLTNVGKLLANFNSDDTVSLQGMTTCGQWSVRSFTFARARKRTVIVPTNPRLRVEPGKLLVVLTMNSNEKFKSTTCVYKGTTNAPIDASMRSTHNQRQTGFKSRTNTSTRTRALIAAISAALLVLSIALILAICYLKRQRANDLKSALDTPTSIPPVHPQEAF